MMSLMIKNKLLKIIDQKQLYKEKYNNGKQIINQEDQQIIQYKDKKITTIILNLIVKKMVKKRIMH